MEIECRNEGYKNESIYQIGNVIENHGRFYLVCKAASKYFLVNLSTAVAASRMYGTLKELELAVADNDDTLVKTKLMVDYKL